MKYNKILKNFSFLVLSIVVITSFVACDQVESVPDKSDILIEEVTGDWYVKLLIDGVDVYEIGYYQLTITNTSTNDGTQMWMDDHEIWPSKVKANIDISDMKFSGSQLENEYSYEDSASGNIISPILDISNGVIIKNGTKASGSRTVVDSISYNVEFSDDPGTIYQIAGYKATGFIDDNH